MTIRVRDTINYLAGKPNILFLIDGLGAMLTAVCLMLVLRNFNEYFGMPKTILTWLSCIAACFCIYSIACYFFLTNYWTPFINGIMFANLLYCVVTTGLLIIYYPQLKIIGAAYFLLEIALIFGLVYLELNVAVAIKKKNSRQLLAN
jgi:cation transport ATPase